MLKIYEMMHVDQSIDTKIDVNTSIDGAVK